MPLHRTFNAINGAEIVEIVTRMIADELSKDTDFRQHITYPRLTFSFELRVQAFPEEPEKIRTMEGTVVAYDKATNKPMPVPEPERPKVLRVRGGVKEQPPDKTREDNRLPVPVPQTLRGVGTVDEPEDHGRGAVVKTRASGQRGATISGKSDA